MSKSTEDWNNPSGDYSLARLLRSTRIPAERAAENMMAIMQGSATVWHKIPDREKFIAEENGRFRRFIER